MSKEKAKRQMTTWIIIMSCIVALGILIAVYGAFGGKSNDKNNVVIIEEEDLLIDFDNDGNTDYVKYIYAEVIYGDENVNFQTGTGE